MTPIEHLALAGLTVLNVVVCWFLPGLTRPDLYFAITVAPGLREDAAGLSILRRYRIELACMSTVVIAGVAASVWWWPAGFLRAALLFQVAASLVVLNRARAAVKPHALRPSTVREADLHRNNRRAVPGGWVVAAGPYVLLAVTHRGTGGQLLGTMAALMATSIMLYGIAHWTRFVKAGDPWELKFRRTSSVIVVCAEYLIAARPASGAIAPLLSLVFLMGATIALARLGQGGNRGARDVPPVGDRMPDERWFMGVIYFNRADPAILIEKRFGLGYTFNFARPMTWAVLFVLLASALVPLLYR